MLWSNDPETLIWWRIWLVKYIAGGCTIHFHSKRFVQHYKSMRKIIAHLNPGHDDENQVRRFPLFALMGICGWHWLSGLSIPCVLQSLVKQCWPLTSPPPTSPSLSPSPSPPPPLQVSRMFLRVTSRQTFGSILTPWNLCAALLCDWMGQWITVSK